MGIVLTATRGSTSLGESKGGRRRRACVEEEDHILADSRRLSSSITKEPALRHAHVAFAPARL